MIKPETLHVRPLPPGDHDTATKLYLAEQEYKRMEVNTGTAYLIFIFAGIFGVHRIYTGRFRSGFTQMFTLGWFGLFLLDFVALPFFVRDMNNFIRTRVNEVYGITPAPEPAAADDNAVAA